MEMKFWRRATVCTVLILATAIVSFGSGAVFGVIYLKGPQPTVHLPAWPTPPVECQVVNWTHERLFSVRYYDALGLLRIESVFISDEHDMSVTELTKRFPPGRRVAIAYEFEQAMVARRTEELYLIAKLPQIVIE